MVPLLLLPLLWGGEWAEGGGLLRVQDSATVQEGLCVQVPCSFSYPWSSWSSPGMPYMNWFRVGDSSYRRYPVATNDRRKTVKTETQGRFLLVGNSRDNNCSLRIREARTSDQGAYEFQVETGDYRKYTYEDKQLTLQVTALTQKPDIHFLEPLKSGHPTNLTCSLPGSCEEGRSLAFFSWVGGSLDSLDPGTLRSSVLTLIPRPRDHGSNLTCQVQLSGTQRTVERTIRLNVSYAPQSLTITLGTLQNTSSILIREGQALRLCCDADSNPPAELSWFRGSPALNATPICKSPILDLPQVGAEEEGDLTCQAQNWLGFQHISLHLSVLCWFQGLDAVSPDSGQPAHVCPSHRGYSVLVSPLRVKARRKQASGSREGLDDEDPVMGTVAWVSDAGVPSRSWGALGLSTRSPDGASSISPPPAPPWSPGRTPGS
uniref:Ig-like domain-containing protein n=1 Tax=Ursus americanus TaxID=9643 RepID=A0A452SGX2_URSAM